MEIRLMDKGPLCVSGNGIIRPATVEDSTELLEIYSPYITRTSISLELEVPTDHEFTERVAAITSRYPYLVWEEDGFIAGYSYAARYHERRGYEYDVATSIYLRPEAAGHGIARRLYRCLFDILHAQGVQIAYAGITLPNPKSERIHSDLDFVPVGVFRRSGRKFGKWHDVLWMEKWLGDFPHVPPPLVGVGELPSGFIQRKCGEWSGRT